MSLALAILAESFVGLFGRNLHKLALEWWLAERKLETQTVAVVVVVVGNLHKLVPEWWLAE